MTAIFDAEAHAQFAREGWAIARDVVPRDHVDAAIAAICAFHAIELRDATTWYRVPPEAWDVVPVHHAQAFWDNRSLPRVHRAFAELLGTEALWVSMDRGGFKPPAGGARATIGRPTSTGMAGRTSTRSCVTEPDVGGREIVHVAGRAGDLVIWNVLLPHRGGRNDGASPRITQYISMAPAGGLDEAARRIALWRERRPPEHWRDWPPTVIDPEPGPPAALNALGRKLLGLDPW